MSAPKYNAREGQGKITFELDPITLRAYLKAIGSLDKDIQNEIRDNSQRMAGDLANDMRRSALIAKPPVARRVAESITTPRDRLPTVKVGGKKRVGIGYRDRRTRRQIQASAGALLYGSEYGDSGAKRDRSGRAMSSRFKAPNRKEGYWINPTVEQWGSYLFQQWLEMVDDILKREGIRG